MALQPLPRIATTILEPALVRIPEGWFTMGSEVGQDNERPVHRVWIDAFLLGAAQVSNEEYARFINSRAAPASPFWTDANFSHPQQPVVAVSWFEATRYCEWLRQQTGRRRPARRSPRPARCSSPTTAAVSRPSQACAAPSPPCPRGCRPCGTRTRTVPSRSADMLRTLSGFTISATTSTSGVATGTRTTITPSLLSAILAVLKAARVEPPGEVHGDTTSRSPAAQPARVFPPSSTTPITGSAWPAI